jgi:hypothetical protein
MVAKENVNVSAMVAGVTTLFGVVGALTATGVLGRLERNEPRALTAAVIVVLLGSVMLVIAGLPITVGRSEIFATLLGTGLTVVGIAWALVAGVLAAGERERPEMHFSITAEGPLVDGRVKSGNLDSGRRLAVLVEGLKVSGASKRWDVFTLAQYYVGPDGDGKVDMPVKVLVPPNRYDAVGIKAWTDERDTCGKYPRRVANEEFKLQVDQAGTGCVVLPLPEPAPEPKAPAAPRVALTWVGNRTTSTRVRLTLTGAGSGSRTVLLAAGRTGGRLRQLLRTVDTGPKAGEYRSTVTLRVGTGFNRVCARARRLAKGDAVPKRLSQCPLARAPQVGTTGDELRRPRRRAG